MLTVETRVIILSLSCVCVCVITSGSSMDHQSETVRGRRALSLFSFLSSLQVISEHSGKMHLTMVYEVFSLVFSVAHYCFCGKRWLCIVSGGSIMHPWGSYLLEGVIKWI